MNRRSWLGFFTLMFVPDTKVATAQTTVGPTIRGLDYLEKQLVTSSKLDENSMDEISARIAWVLSGQILTSDARERTLSRAYSDKEDLIGVWPKRENMGPTKRNLCIAILNLDDKNREMKKQSP